MISNDDDDPMISILNDAIAFILREKEIFIFILIHIHISTVVTHFILS